MPRKPGQYRANVLLANLFAEMRYDNWPAAEKYARDLLIYIEERKVIPTLNNDQRTTILKGYLRHIREIATPKETQNENPQ